MVAVRTELVGTHVHDIFGREASESTVGCIRVVDDPRIAAEVGGHQWRQVFGLAGIDHRGSAEQVIIFDLVGRACGAQYRVISPDRNGRCAVCDDQGLQILARIGIEKQTDEFARSPNGTAVGEGCAKRSGAVTRVGTPCARRTAYKVRIVGRVTTDVAVTAHTPGPALHATILDADST